MGYCEACDHESILGQVDYGDDDNYWLDTVDSLGHVCNENNCKHTCDLGDYYYA